jgi:ribose transport system substrate-binding protein
VERTTRLAAVATLLAAVVAGCSSASSTGTTSTAATSSSSARTASHTSKITRVTFVNILASYPGWLRAQQCADSEAAKYGITVTNSGPPGANVDPQGMANDIDQAVAQGTQAIITSPPDSSSLTAPLNAAKAKGIPVVTILSGNNYPGRVFDIGTNLADLGKVVMDGIGAKDPNAHIITISLSTTQTVQQEVLAGFWAEAAAKFPNIKRLPPIYDQGQTTNTVSLVTDALTAHPDATAIYELEGAGTNGVAAALRAKGMQAKVLLVANDAPPSTRALIQQGVVYGVGIQQWCTMGTGAVDNLVRFTQGQSVPKSIQTSATFVTKENLSTAGEQD